MTTTDKIFYTFMFIASAVIIALILSLTTGCVGPLQPGPARISECDPLSVTVTERAMDPCELEYWEDEQFASRDDGCG